MPESTSGRADRTWEWTVDEVFELPRRGIVVTGVRDGAVHTGDEATVDAPTGGSQRALVVGIEHMRRTDGGSNWGLVLSGVKLDQIPIGSVVRRLAEAEPFEGA